MRAIHRRAASSGGRTGSRTFALFVGLGLLWMCATAIASELPVARQKPVLLAPSPVPVEPRVPARQPEAIQLGEGALAELLQQRHESTVRVRTEMGPHPMSRKGLARRDARVRKLLRADGLTEPDTVKILLVRIAFDTDRSGELTSVTENGDFLLDPDPEYRFDPPPHDRRYFEAHLEGLAEYWKSMSSGMVVAETRVLPDGDRDAYRLSDIADYAPGSGGFWTVPLLEVLVQDMIRATDEGMMADGSGSLSDWDFDDPNTHVIFAHAGADLQSNLVWQEGTKGYSPNDIPTFFVTLGDSAIVDLVSLDSSTGEPGRMTECSVIPETTTQDGLIGSISAALMHEFGHALGLPDLYSTTTGLPTIGFWGIMDSGTNLSAVVGRADAQGNQLYDDDGNPVVDFVTGLLPPQASLWSKWYLGFAKEFRVGAREQSLSLPASYRTDTRRKALRIDVSPNEFFLVENRYVPPLSQSNWSLTLHAERDVVLYLGEYDPAGRLIGNTNLYDFFMPWYGGLLVWRIRQDRIEDGLAFNRVQGERNNLGVELVEADGIQDIGVYDFSTRGFLGSSSDAFRDVSSFAYTIGDSVYTEFVPATSTSFGPDTVPSSASSFRIPTGARLRDIGPFSRDATRITGRVDGPLDGNGTGPGFPVQLPDRTSVGVGPTVVRGDEASATPFVLGGQDVLLVAGRIADGSELPSLYGFRADGSSVEPSGPIVDLAAPLAGPPVVAEEAASFPGARVLVTASRDGSIGFFRESSGRLERFASSMVDEIDCGPRVLDHAAETYVVAAHVGDNRLVSVGASGDVVDADFGLSNARLLSAPVLGVVADSDGVATSCVVFVTDRGLDARSATGLSIEPTVFPIELGAVATDSTGAGRLLALEGEGDSDAFVFVDAQGSLRIVTEREGVWRVDRGGVDLDGPIVGDLVGADVDGDGVTDVVAATSERLYALHVSGTPLRGFPRRISEVLLLVEYDAEGFAGSPVVADIDQDGFNEIIVITRFGLVHAFESDGAPVDGFPRVASGAAQAPAIFDYDRAGERQRALVLFDALGDTLGAGRRTRSARLNLLHLGEAPGGARPSEWLALGGGARRDGRALKGTAASGAPSLAAQLGEAMLLPNPLRGENGDRVFVRYFSGGEHDCVITVYNLEGEEVGRWTESVVAAGEPVHVGWSAAGLRSGPYLCRVDYLGAEGRRTDLKTLYIER